MKELSERIAKDKEKKRPLFEKKRVEKHETPLEMDFLQEKEFEIPVQSKGVNKKEVQMPFKIQMESIPNSEKNVSLEIKNKKYVRANKVVMPRIPKTPKPKKKSPELAADKFK